VPSIWREPFDHDFIQTPLAKHASYS
jgi:hypothetical protein